MTDGTASGAVCHCCDKRVESPTLISDCRNNDSSKSPDFEHSHFESSPQGPLRQGEEISQQLQQTRCCEIDATARTSRSTLTREYIHEKTEFGKRALERVLSGENTVCRINMPGTLFHPVQHTFYRTNDAETTFHPVRKASAGQIGLEKTFILRKIAKRPGFVEPVDKLQSNKIDETPKSPA